MGSTTGGAIATAYVDILVSHTKFAQSLAKARTMFSKGLSNMGGKMNLASAARGIQAVTLGLINAGMKGGKAVLSIGKGFVAAGSVAGKAMSFMGRGVVGAAKGAISAFMSLGSLGGKAVLGLARGFIGLTKGVGSVFGGIKSLMGPLGSLLPMIGIIGAAGIFAKGIMEFSRFEYAMARVKAITGTTGKTFEDLSDLSRKLGRDTVFTATDAAEAMGYLAKAGFKASQVTVAMAPTLDLAAAGQLDMATSADIVAKIMKGMGLNAEETGRAVDVMAKAFTTSNTDLQMLGEAFKYVGPNAKAVGSTLEQTAAAVQVLSDAGLQGSMAGTSLRQIFMKLINPSKAGKAVLKELGVEIADASGKMKPMATIVDELNVATAGMTEMDRNETLGKLADTRALTGLLVLMDAGGNKMRDFESQLKGSAGWAKQVAATQLDSLQGTWMMFTSSLEDTAIELGKAMAPALRLVMTEFVALFATMTPIVAKVDELAMAIGMRLANGIKGANGWLKEHADLLERVFGFLSMAVNNPWAAIKAAGLTAMAGGMDLMAVFARAGGGFITMLRAAFSAGVTSLTSNFMGIVDVLAATLSVWAREFEIMIRKMIPGLRGGLGQAEADLKNEKGWLDLRKKEVADSMGTSYSTAYDAEYARLNEPGGLANGAEITARNLEAAGGVWTPERTNSDGTVTPGSYTPDSYRARAAGIMAANQAGVDADRLAAREAVGKRKAEEAARSVGMGIMGYISGPMESLTGALNARAGGGGGVAGLFSGLGRLGFGALSGMSGMFTGEQFGARFDMHNGVVDQEQTNYRIPAGLSAGFGTGLNSLITSAVRGTPGALRGLGSSVGGALEGMAANPLSTASSAFGIVSGLLTGGVGGVARAAMSGIGLEEQINRTDKEKSAKDAKRTAPEGGGDITDITGFLAGMQKSVFEKKKDQAIEDGSTAEKKIAEEAPQQTTWLERIHGKLDNLNVGFA